MFGTFVDSELAKIKRGKKEGDAMFNMRLTNRLLELVTVKEKKQDRKFAAPVVKRWKGGKPSA